MPVNVGVIGCGFISDVYLRNLQTLFNETHVQAVADRDVDRARSQAVAYDVPVVCASNAEMYARDDVEIILNLTVPSEHYGVTKAALLAGKHVYSEKPLGISLEEGVELQQIASERGLLLASAPDTFFGSGIQTSRHLIETGWIGKPFGFVGHQFWAGAEAWHPEPEFLYQSGAGPLLDSGPYFIAALVHLFGSATQVGSFGTMPFSERTIGSGPRAGVKFPVDVDTFVSSVLRFESGVVGSLTVSTDVPNSRMQDERQHNHGIEIYGTEGVLAVPSPCFYEGTVYCRRSAAAEWTEIPDLFPYREDSRGIGVADMAHALLTGGKPRLDLEMTFHIFEILMRLRESGRLGSELAISSAAGETRGLPLGVAHGDVDKA